MTDEQTPGIGHNRSPEETAPETTAPAPRPVTLDPEEIAANLAVDYREIVDRAKVLLEGDGDKVKGFAGFPTKVETPEQSQRATDFAGMLAACAKRAEQARATEKGRFDTAAKAVQGFFKAGIIDRLDQARADVERRNGAFLSEQRRIEQDRLDRERREREEQARRDAEAAEAARKAAETTADADDDDYGAPDPEEQRRLAALAEAQAAESAAAAEQAARQQAKVSGAGLSGATTHLRETLVVGAIDMEAVDLRALRPYLAVDDVRKAARAWLKVNKEALQRGDKTLKGVTFDKETKAQTRS